jgi:hypothetical protein
LVEKRKTGALGFKGMIEGWGLRVLTDAGDFAGCEKGGTAKLVKRGTNHGDVK